MPTSASLRPGDIVSEIVHGESVDKDTRRNVKVKTVEDGMIYYRGDWCYVVYVSGEDIANRKTVKYTKTLHFRWENVARAADSLLTT